MKSPAIPRNEAKRLEALKALDIVETTSEKEYDDITKLAAMICETPIALITLIEEKRQWFKAKIGIDICENDRDKSICGHALKDPYKILEIEDTRLDDRFIGNPVIHNEDQPIIFYAGVPLTDPGGNALGTLCVIDHKPGKLNQKQTEALKALGNQVIKLFELRRKNIYAQKIEDDLRNRNNLLKEFAGTVSHDMKMPLSNIILTIDTLKKRYGESFDEKLNKYLDYLKQSSFRLSHYIADILTFYESDHIASEENATDSFDIQFLLEEIVDMFNIQEDCQINFPEKNIELYCNRTALEQILLNLLGNSLKYNDKKETVITINCWEEAIFYHFTITDNGRGIPQQKQVAIFDLFSTATETDRYGNKGNGIGLSTVKKLVNNLGGDISVESTPGESTTFHFSIKKSKAQQSA